MIYLIYSLVVTFLEIICADIIVNAFCSKRCNNKWFNIAMYTLMWGLVFVTCNLNYVNSRFVLKIAIIILIFTLIMYVVYQISIIQSIVLASLFETLDLLLDYLILIIVEYILGYFLPAQDGFSIAQNVMVVVSKSLLFMAVIIIRNIFGRRKTEMLNFREWMKFLVCPFVTICVLCTVYYESGGIKSFQSDISNLIIIIGLVVINVAQYYMLNDTIKTQKRRQTP